MTRTVGTVRRVRRLSIFLVVAGALAAACTDDSPPSGSDAATTVVFEAEGADEADGAQVDEVAAGSPVEGLEPVTEYDLLIGFWVPNGAVGRDFIELFADVETDSDFVFIVVDYGYVVPRVTVKVDRYLRLWILSRRNFFYGKHSIAFV